MVNFAMPILPPFASMARMVASILSTAIVHSKPIMPVPATGSRRLCMAPWMPGFCVVAGVDQVEAGRSPGLEAPAEHLSRRTGGARDVVHVNRKEADVVCHRQKRTRTPAAASCARVTKSVASAPTRPHRGAGAVPVFARPRWASPAATSACWSTSTTGRSCSTPSPAP